MKQSALEDVVGDFLRSVAYLTPREIQEKVSQTTKETAVQDKFTATNDSDVEGLPTGGSVHGTGLSITWQNGPLGRGKDRVEPNGAFVETVIAAAKQRIEYYNDTKFRCRENSLAITKLEEALHWLNHRTAEREARGVEGTHVA